MNVTERLTFAIKVMQDIYDQPIDPCRLAKINVKQVAAILIEAQDTIKTLTEEKQRVVEESMTRNAVLAAQLAHMPKA